MINERYKSSIVGSNSSGKRVYDTTMYPVIDKDINDIYIVTRDTDRLDILAHRYYGDSRSWWIIAVANNLNNGSLVVPAGTRLRIPQTTSDISFELDRLQVSR